MDRDPLTERIIGCAIEVHRALGPGLLESAYEKYLAFELCQHGMQFRHQVPVPVEHKGARIECGYRIGLLISVNQRRLIDGLRRLRL